jgi:hypothetical protein
MHLFLLSLSYRIAYYFMELDGENAFWDPWVMGDPGTPIHLP